MNYPHYDCETRDFTLRFGRRDEQEGLAILEKETALIIAWYPLAVEDLRRILRGGSFQSNRPEGYLLVRPTSEGIWTLFEKADVGLSGSCLIPRQELLGIVAILGGDRDHH